MNAGEADAAFATPSMTSFALFETPVGTCAIAWNARGIAAVRLPEATAAMTRARLRRHFPDGREDVPAAHAGDIIDKIQALLAGGHPDFTEAVLDMAGVPAFHRAVYEVARTIPPGATLTYGGVAARLGEPGAARAVGQALGQNPIAIVVPCHRVLAAGDKPGGFSAYGGAATKLRLLAIEGALPPPAPTLFDQVGGLPR